MTIVFVSDDMSFAHFEKNFAQMNAHAVPYDEVEIKKSLKSKLDVLNIPAVVVCTEKGIVLTRNGYEDIINRGY
jgi:hypothetical protein